jgi:hypothetical protein
MNTIKQVLLLFLLLSMIFISCDDKEYGANLYDPDTKITASQMPKVYSFYPVEGESGEVIKIKGVNYTTATAVTFGGKTAEFFEIESDSVILAVVGPYGGTGAVGVTNHKGTRSLNGFIYIKNTPVEVSNLALNKPTTASTNLTPSDLAVDGDLNTRWSAENGDNQWFQVDLQKLYSINTIVIRWEAAYAVDYDLQVSEDNINFTSVYSTLTGSGGNDSISFAGIDARYVKILLNQRGTPWAMSFWEFEVYNIPPPVNLALGKTATTSGDFNSPSLALDGDLSTRWSTLAGDNHWFMVDLGQVYKVGRAFIYWEGAYASEYDIQLSTDGVNFTTVYSTTTGTGGDVNHTFTQADARYVKILLIKQGTPWNMSFFEFEVYEN